MRYILADKGKAVKAGFSTTTHLSGSTYMMLNEREVSYSPMLTGENLDDRAQQLGGSILTEKEAELHIKEGGLV